MTSILFVLPTPARVPAGGYRIAFEYANRLRKLGYRVGVCYPARLGGTTGIDAVKRAAIAPARKLHYERLLERVGPSGGWFDLDPEVEYHVSTWGGRTRISDWDVAVATSWRTAHDVASSTCPGKVYLIQHHEIWDGPEDAVNRTWRLPLHKVVISQWLADLAQRLDPEGAVSYVPNGMDLDLFRVTTPRDKRDPFSVGMMLHKHPWKGTEYGLKALEIAKSREPRLKASLFGAYDVASVPDWAEVRLGLHGDAVVDYYNQLSVFAHPSLVEGWPLPPAEAMACGAALVAADNPGVLDYATADTARVVPRQDPERMAEAIVRLIQDAELATSTAEAGHAAIQAYTWDRAVAAFRAAVDVALERP